MKNKNLLLFLVLTCFSSLAETKIMRAVAIDGSFKFVALGDDGVYKSSDGKITLRCKYGDYAEGIDNDAAPYAALSFDCDGGKHIVVKATSGTDKATLRITDNEWNIRYQASVKMLWK